MTHNRALTKFTPTNFLSRANSLATEMDRFLPSSLLFDSFFKDIDELFNVPKGSFGTLNYPPCNVVKTGDGEYEIHLAVAGFKKDEISVTSSNDYLKITGKKMTEVAQENDAKDEDTYPQYFYRGIAGREFTNRFQLAPNTIINNVSLEDGILNVKLRVQVPEEAKEKTYLIK